MTCSLITIHANLLAVFANLSKKDVFVAYITVLKYWFGLKSGNDRTDAVTGQLLVHCWLRGIQGILEGRLFLMKSVVRI